MVVVALALLLGACSGGDDDDVTDTSDPVEAVDARVEVAAADLAPFTDVDPDDVGGPGTALGGGLEVPEGALLQGTTFPDLVGGGFRALLLLTGDPVAVYDALAAQAVGLGMQGPGGCLGDATIVGCQATFVDPADGESLAVSVSRKLDPANGVVSGVGLLYRPPGSVEDAPEAPGGLTPTTPLPPVVLPDPVPVPAPEDIARAVRVPGSPMRTLETGSVLVGLPGPCACEGGGWSVVVRLDGVARDVVHGYARQFSDLGEPPDLEDRHRDDLTLVGMRIGEGDASAEIRGFLPDEGEAYAIITVRGT